MEGNLSSEIKRFMRSVEAANPDMVAGARISTAWHKVMDKAVIQHTDAVYAIPGSQGSDVIIYTDNAIWAADLNLQAEMLRLRLNMALRDMDGDVQRPRSHKGALLECEDPETVKRLRFIVSKDSYRTRDVVLSTEEQLEEQQHQKVEVIPLTAQEEELLRQQIAHIEDERVREAAYQAAKAGMELAKARDY